ncbi:hypothetical protein Nmel_014568 [Mimus melanotis]
MQCGHAAELAWQPAYTLWYLFHWRRSSSWFGATKEEEELIAEEELTPEEKRKLERKLKKERKKKEKQLMREAGISIKKVEPKKPSGSERALAYLTR